MRREVRERDEGERGWEMRREGGRREGGDGGVVK